MKGIIDRLRLIVELVTGVTIDSDGVFSAKGADDHELEGAVGYHFGFYSRPNDGVNGLVLKADGQGNTSFLIAFRDKQYELSLEKGEVGIRNAFEASILLDKNGAIALTAKAGQRVTVNGDTYKALKTSNFLSALSSALGTILASNSGGNILSDGGTLMTALLNGITANSYDSDKVSHG